MANDSGGVTLKIDADTAGFIAQIAHMAQATKKLHEGPKEAGEAFKKMGEFAKDAASEIAGISLSLSPMALGIGAIAGAIETWKKNLEDTAKIQEKMLDINQAIARAGMGKDAASITATMQGAAPNLKPEQISKVFSAITAPEGLPDATQGHGGQIETLTAAAGLAAKAGMDPATYSGANARLTAGGIANSSELAYYAMRYIGDGEREQALTAAIEAPGSAGDILKAYAGASRTPGKGVKGVLNEIMKAYLAHGKKGSFSDFLKSATAFRAAGRDNRGYLKILRDGKPPAINDKGLEEGAESAEKDPLLKHETGVAEHQTFRDKIELDHHGQEVIDHQNASERVADAITMEDSPFRAIEPSWNVFQDAKFRMKGMVDKKSAELSDYIQHGGSMSFKDFVAKRAAEAAKAKALKASSPLVTMRQLVDAEHMYHALREEDPNKLNAQSLKRMGQLKDLLEHHRLRTDAQGEDGK